MKKKWSGVPQEYSAAWRNIFNAADPTERMHLRSDCPVCGEKDLYRYFSLEKVKPRDIGGLMYKGPGSYWEWCSSCHSFEHMSGYVPDWWDVEPLEISSASLTAIPDLIDEAMRLKSGKSGA